jgi:hypothetical protein
MTDHKNIHEAILAIYNKVGYVQKERSQNLNYTFASEKEFIKTLRPVMIENGVTVYVKSMNQIVQTEYTTRNNAVMLRTNIHGVVTFTHVSGSFVDVESYGEGADSGDKSTNKAMTDLYKYALRQTFMIETGDDPDKDISEPGIGHKTSGKTTKPQNDDEVFDCMNAKVIELFAKAWNIEKVAAAGEVSKLKESGKITGKMSLAQYQKLADGAE